MQKTENEKQERKITTFRIEDACKTTAMCKEKEGLSDLFRRLTAGSVLGILNVCSHAMRLLTLHSKRRHISDALDFPPWERRQKRKAPRNAYPNPWSLALKSFLYRGTLLCSRARINICNVGAPSQASRAFAYAVAALVFACGRMISCIHAHGTVYVRLSICSSFFGDEIVEKSIVPRLLRGNTSDDMPKVKFFFCRPQHLLSRRDSEVGDLWTESLF